MNAFDKKQKHLRWHYWPMLMLPPLITKNPVKIPARLTEALLLLVLRYGIIIDINIIV